MNVELIKEFRFEAAHRNLSSSGPGSRMHGHSFRVEVALSGKIDPALDWLIDFSEIGAAMQPLLAQLDHHYINHLHGINEASLQDIALWITERLEPQFPPEFFVTVRMSTSGDNEFRVVELEADPDFHLPRRLGFTFEAAQSLPHLPPEHPCRRLHGHSYRVEVAAENLDTLPPLLREIYDVADHRLLNDLPGLESATSERLCAWIWDRLAPRAPGLSLVVVQETATSRCLYRGT